MRAKENRSVFGVIWTCFVAIALVSHTYWGCAVCHSQMHPEHAQAGVGSGQCLDEQQDSEPHERHLPEPCSGNGGCIFVLRLPTDAKPFSGSTYERLLAMHTACIGILIYPALNATVTTPNCGAPLAESRQPQHQILLL